MLYDCLNYEKIYVGGLSYDIKKSDISRVFQKYGEIRRITLNRETYGFVLFNHQIDPMTLLRINGTMINGRRIIVNYSFRKRSFSSSNSSNSSRFSCSNRSRGKSPVRFSLSMPFKRSNKPYNISRFEKSANNEKLNKNLQTCAASVSKIKQEIPDDFQLVL